MRPNRPLTAVLITGLTTAVLATVLSACGSAQGTDGSGRDAAATPTSSTGVGSAPGSAVERATARGLAAAVIAHLGDTDVLDASGGLTDMEDTRGLGVDLRLDLGSGHNQLTVRAADPEYLPGDRGDFSCDDVGEVGEAGMTFRCNVLDDGTTVLVMTSEHGFSDDNAAGSATMAMVSGPGRELQLAYESYDPDGSLDADLIEEIASDPLVGWTTSAAHNAAGERLADFRQTDRVDRDGEEGYDESTPDVAPAP